ncbi:MAG: UDP-N-acetylmuramate dehydrogenase [Ruminococcaceae bacterium]|nr:UDP-N-acetylmuramate dehydrogenase [Oscillospiraceae bacterium]
MSVFEKVCTLLSSLEKEGKIRSEEYELCEKYSLARLTSFKTGGVATVLFPETLSVAAAIYPLLKKEDIPIFVLGNGSNVIARDEGYDGLILSLIRLKKTQVSDVCITAESGALLTTVATLAQRNALTGMEALYGIPGTVGGAVFMNAGAYGTECRDVLAFVNCITSSGEFKTYSVDELALGYRTSRFEESDDLILSATFRLKKGKAEEIRAAMDDFMARRVEKQPLEYPSAGSTFKRYEGRFTAQLIDENGLKGYRHGGAMVSEKHAGFVINYDHATSSDIFAVIEKVQETIFESEGIRIQREVRIIE